jgi:PAS domain S-box-containing protein
MGAMTRGEVTLSERILRGRDLALQRLARGAPLDEILEIITRGVEECFPDLRCSILLLDASGRLRHGAAPSLPDFYVRAIEGLEIGPNIGSCGAAAARRTRVVVENVHEHPNWARFRDLARRAEVQACWSEPLLASSGDVLGTFALYYGEPRGPRPMEIESIVSIAHIAAIAVERKRDEERLRCQEERFRQLAETIREVFYLTEWNPDRDKQEVLYVSPAYETVWGRTCASLREDPRSWSYDIHPEDRDRMVRSFLEDATKGAYEVEYRLLRRDGSVRWIYDRAFPIRDAQGKVYRIAGISEDVTRYKEIELSLRQSEEMFRQLAENIRGVFWLSDWPDWRVVYASPAWEAIWGASRSRLSGDSRLDWAKYIHPEDRRRAAELLEQDAAAGRYDADFRVVHPGGEIRWLHERAFPIRDAGGNVVRMAGLVEDITERKRAEEEIRRAHDQVEALRREQVESLASELLLAEERERRRLAQDLHDDLNQTIALARLKLGQVLDQMQGPLRCQAQEIVDLVNQANESARSLTFQLSPPILHDLGFEPAVQWLVEDVGKRYGLQIALEGPGDPSPLSERIRVLLFRAVRELLINVAKHAGAMRTKVGLERTDGSLRIVVEDDGQAFDPRIVGCRGLGLSGIRERLSHMGGEMIIETAVGRGTRVTLVAPLERAKECLG